MAHTFLVNVREEDTLCAEVHRHSLTGRDKDTLEAKELLKRNAINACSRGNYEA